MFYPIKVNWFDKSEKQTRTLQLDAKDITRIAKRLKVEPHEVKTKLVEGEVVETELHTYQTV